MQSSDTIASSTADSNIGLQWDASFRLRWWRCRCFYNNNAIIAIDSVSRSLYYCKLDACNMKPYVCLLSLPFVPLSLMVKTDQKQYNSRLSIRCSRIGAPMHLASALCTLCTNTTRAPLRAQLSMRGASRAYLNWLFITIRSVLITAHSKSNQVIYRVRTRCVRKPGRFDKFRREFSCENVRFSARWGSLLWGWWWCWWWSTLRSLGLIIIEP